MGAPHRQPWCQALANTAQCRNKDSNMSHAARVAMRRFSILRGTLGWNHAGALYTPWVSSIFTMDPRLVQVWAFRCRRLRKAFRKLHARALDASIWCS